MRTTATALPVSRYTTSYQPSAIFGDEPLSPAVSIQRSQWRSPVPYLFGGLAAMLGLIAFALLILACSYWKLSGEVNAGETINERDSDGGDAAGKTDKNANSEASLAFEEKFLVVMAGEAKPTFLATRKAASFYNEVGESEIEDSNSRLDRNQIET